MSAERQAQAAAATFRDDHGLGDQPLADLVTLIERTTGADVVIADAPAHAHGMTAHDPATGATFIAVATAGRPMRQRSTLAHELGHLVFNDRAAEKEGHWPERDPFEIRADAFARHLLIPVSAVTLFFGAADDVSEQHLSDVVQWFAVSPVIAAIALRDAGLIGDSAKTAWMHISTPTLAARYGWIDQYNAMKANSARRRSPQKLGARAIRGYREGIVGVATIARLFGTDERGAHAILDSGDGHADGNIPWASADHLPDSNIDLSDLEDLTESAE